MPKSYKQMKKNSWKVRNYPSNSKLPSSTVLCASVTISRSKIWDPDEFSPNCFPITPPRNGNIGNGYRDLLESGFKVGENSPMPKKIAGEMFTKNRNNFFGTCLFSTFKAKNVIFCSRMCCWITHFISCKKIFQKFSFFYRYCRRYGCALYFVRTLYFVRLLYLWGQRSANHGCSWGEVVERRPGPPRLLCDKCRMLFVRS